MKNKRSMMESEYDVKDIVILDNGTDTLKVGLSGEDYPKLIYDTCCGVPTLSADMDNIANKPQLLFGQQLKQAISDKKLSLQLSYPIEEARIDNIEQMKDFWVHCLEDGLQISELSQVNILIIDQVKNSKDYKYKIAEALFDYLKVQSVLFMNASTLSLFATGAVTGLSIEMGHALNTVVPIYQGFPMQHALQYSYISGKAITNQLANDLKSQVQFDKFSEMEQQLIVREIKETMCYVADDYLAQTTQYDTFDEELRSYQLPDETVIQIDPLTRYRCGESLFDSSIANNQCLSLSQMIGDSVSRCDSELQYELISNIVLGGGTSMFQGLTNRLRKEVSALLPRMSDNDFNYVADFQRKYSAWIGGSMLGSLSTFQSLAITRAEYEENPEGKIQIIHKRTF